MKIVRRGRLDFIALLLPIFSLEQVTVARLFDGDRGFYKKALTMCTYTNTKYIMYRRVMNIGFVMIYYNTIITYKAPFIYLVSCVAHKIMRRAR